MIPISTVLPPHCNPCASRDWQKTRAKTLTRAAPVLWINAGCCPPAPCDRHPSTKRHVRTKEGDHIQMKKLRATALLCTLLFAVGVFAFQYPSTQPNSGQMGTSPSQQTTQPSQTTPPSQEQTPSTSPSQQEHQPAQGQMPNIDNQVKMLSDQLNLTSDQQSKVRVILVDQHEQAMGVIKDNALSREDKLAKIHSLREGTIAKVR